MEGVRLCNACDHFVKYLVRLCDGTAKQYSPIEKCVEMYYLLQDGEIAIIRRSEHLVIMRKSYLVADMVLHC